MCLFVPFIWRSLDFFRMSFLFPNKCEISKINFRLQTTWIRKIQKYRYNKNRNKLMNREEVARKVIDTFKVQHMTFVSHWGPYWFEKNRHIVTMVLQSMRSKCVSYRMLNLLNKSVTVLETSLLFTGNSYPLFIPIFLNFFIMFTIVSKLLFSLLNLNSNSAHLRKISFHTTVNI